MLVRTKDAAVLDRPREASASQIVEYHKSGLCAEHFD